MNYRHGDLSFHPINELPKGLKEIKHKGEYVLAYGEHTGHKHKIVAEKMQIFQDGNGRYYLKVNNSATITHEEHKTITLRPGIYRQEQELERDAFLNEIKKVVD